MTPMEGAWGMLHPSVTLARQSEHQTKYLVISEDCGTRTVWHSQCTWGE